MRPVLVGESNPYSCEPLWPLPPRASGGRLCRLLGMSETEYVSTFERHNLMNGDPWCDKYASFSASALLGAYPKGHIVCLGAKVSAAFYTKGPLEWWSAVWMGGPTIYKVPHPSGMNRMWNDSRNVERLCIVVREAIAASAGVR